MIFTVDVLKTHPYIGQGASNGVYKVNSKLGKHYHTRERTPAANAKTMKLHAFYAK